MTQLADTQAVMDEPASLDSLVTDLKIQQDSMKTGLDALTEQIRELVACIEVLTPTASGFSPQPPSNIAPSTAVSTSASSTATIPTPLTTTCFMIAVNFPTFSGDQSKAYTWLKRMRDTGTLAKLDDIALILHAGAYLKGPAQNWYLAEVRYKGFTEWSEFEDAFHERYLGEEQQLALKERIKTARIRRNESIMDFVDRMQCYYLEYKGRMKEEKKVKWIMRGLLSCTPLTIVFQKGLETVPALRAFLQNLPGALDCPEKYTGRGKDKAKCFFCDHQGHLIADCRKKTISDENFSWYGTE